MAASVSLWGFRPEPWDHTATHFSHAAGAAPLPTACTRRLSRDLGTQCLTVPSLWVIPSSDDSLGVDSRNEAIEQQRSIFKHFTNCQMTLQKGCANSRSPGVNGDRDFPELANNEY